MPERRKASLVLVVDDDARSARLLVRMLREDGFEVELCTDGASAIGRLSRSPIPDVLVTDFRMPYADGFAVARFGRSQRPEMPILMVTGYSEQMGKLQRALTPPPVVLSKPLEYSALSDELRRIVSTGEAPPGPARPALH